ncbi:MAG: DUF1929 domain-containing protein, partial [Gemmatimonadetes bacterium]|nr:DUF1929 domain-containing protein [Gemmatimonadota bacterium]
MLLADGTVLVVGGEYFDGSNVHTANNSCEIFDDHPTSPSWALVDSLGAPRRYHSEAILLPDGRVFVTGDEAEAPPVTSVDSSGTYEIFYPPYLFESATTWAKRPEILSDPTYVAYGVPFAVTIDHEDSAQDANDIAEVVLMAPGSSTHSTNMTQRRIRLASVVHNDSTLAVAAPLDGTWAPPGAYMLIVVDSAGVPSIGDFLTVCADSGYTVASGEESVWFGEVSLDRDFEVESGGILTILPGTTVQIAANDASQGNRDATRVELILRDNSTLVCTGNAGSPITLQGDPSGSPAAGAWYGPRIEDWDDVSITYTDLKHARGALALEDGGLTTAQLNALLANAAGLTFTDNVTDVSFDRDLVVESFETLTVPAGWRLGFAANLDQSAGPAEEKDASLAELIIKGGVSMVGSIAARIGLGSDDPSPAAGQWYGAWFQDTVDTLSVSSMKNVDFDAAFYAVGVDSMSGDIFDCTFQRSAGGDIYVDRDTRVIEGHEWKLQAPTEVVARAESDGGDASASGEDTVRVEIVVDGTLRTQSAAPGTDWTTFTSTAEDSLGSDWAGITVRGYGVGEFYDADIGHAVNPISFMALWNDSATVSRSSVHHYSGVGILDWHSAAVVESTAVNGELLLGELGDTGIHVISSPATIRHNQVTSHLKYGVLAEYSSGACLAPPTNAPSETVTIARNEIVGGGAATGGAQKGITLKWICHNVSAVLKENNVQRWGQHGIRLLGTTDTQVSCNCIVENATGVRYQTKQGLVPAADGITDFFQNDFDANNDLNVEVVKGHGVSFGDGSTLGRNRFKRGGGADPFNVKIAYADPIDLDAQENVWYDSLGVLLPDSTKADPFFNADIIGEVDEANFLSSPQPF